MPGAKEWVAEFKARRGVRWGRVDPDEPPRTEAACHASIARKRRRYPDPHVEYRLRNLKTRETIAV